MSEIINPTGNNDLKIEEIRNQVKAHSDAIPYLLLPLKIETRFMRVDRPVFEKDTFPEVLDELFAIDDSLQFDPKNLPEHEVLGKLGKLVASLETTVKKVGEIKRITGNDKDLLLSALAQLDRNYKKLGQELSRLRWRDVARLKQLRLLKTDMNKQVTLLENGINGLKVTADIESNDADNFLNLIATLNKSLSDFGGNDLATNDRKAKRGVFSFVENQFSALNKTIKDVREFTRINIQATKQQVNRLDKSKSEWKDLLLKIGKNINTIKSDFKKTEYKEKLEGLKKGLNALEEAINFRLKPKMDLMLSLSVVDARQFLSTINHIRYKLKHQNKKPFHDFDEVSTSSQKLFSQLKELKNNAFKVIEGNREELVIIKKAWDDADAELEKLKRRLDAFKGVGDQKKKVAQLSKKLDHDFRETLMGLKSKSKSNFTSLTNSVVEKTALTLHQSLNTLKDIQKDIEENIGKPKSQKFTGAIKKLVDFQKSYEKISTSMNVIPQKSYNEINRITAKIKSNVKSFVDSDESMSLLSGRAQGESKKALFAVDSLKTTIEQQPTDALTRTGRTAEASRSSILFASRTITRDELWVRIYPDDIAIHSHEIPLTPEELESGKAYWKEIWAANEDYEIKLAAWRAISTSYGSQRAAWIVKSLEPAPSKSSDVKKKFRDYSREILKANDELLAIHKSLSESADINDQIVKMGQTFSQLNTIEASLKRVKGGHESLLMKSQRILLKIQSQVNSVIRMIQNSRGSSVNERQIQVVKQYVNVFNKTTKTFKEIKSEKSTEIIDKQSDDDVFPDVEIKESSWTVAPHSKVMPDRFVVVLKDRSGKYKHLAVGEPLPEDQLIVGLNPESFDTDTFEYDEDGNLIVDESIKWLTDFEEARKIGMALFINLDEEDLENGFDKVFVLGVKDTTPQIGKKLIEELIDNHHYLPEGASFLPIRTPTNNTEAGESGYRTFEEDAGLSFKIERNDEVTGTTAEDPDFPTDGKRLSEGLGIDVDVLNNLDYHDRTEISEALLMNRALFHGTLGNYMEEGLDTLFTLDNIDHTKEFFCNHVSARGYIPSIRIGTQPYGILPTTAFSKFQVTSNDAFIPQLNKDDFDNIPLIKDELQVRYDIRLKNFLSYLDNFWTSIRNSKVPHAGNTDPDNPQAHFMEMLGLQPNSAELYYRYGLNIASRQSVDAAADFSINFDSSDPWSPTQVADAFRNIISSGYYFKSDSFTDEQNEDLKIDDPVGYLNSKNSRISNQFVKARVFATRHLQNQSLLLGHIIDNRELAEEIIAASDPNADTAEDQSKARAELQYFIDWLVDENPWDVHAENKFSETSEGILTTGMPSRSLLFLLLRHSILSANVDAILKVLEFEGLTDQETRKKMGQPGHFYNRFRSGFNYVTKWTYLFSKINYLDHVLGFDMNEENSFYIYMNSLSSSSNGYLNRYLSPKHTFIFNGYPNHHLHQGFKNALDATRESIRKLKDIPTARLEQLLAEHLDLCTYRLDAWRLGMVNRRLKQQRSTNTTGIFIGAYGWVEDLNKGGERPLAKNIPEGLWKSGDDPIYEDADNLGFIHTPSLNHAITAAILRAGFDANSGIAEIENQMAVNLSSARVRMALNLLNGIRNGQEAAALLGYQFERGLHEGYLHLSLELDEYIYDFREEFPLSVPVDDSVSLGEATLNNVVNGMELLEEAQEFIDSKGGPPNPGDSLYESLKAFEPAWWNHINNTNLKNATSAEKDAMLKEIDRMADAFDALGDLCISESVYQVAKGNHVRASAIMDKLSRGDVPNDIEIADTPRTGTVVTHKVGMFFETISGIDHKLTETGNTSTPVSGNALKSAVTAANARPVGWNSDFTPRAMAEPTLNKWAGQMIGNPAKIKCIANYTMGDINDSMTVSLADLGIQPLDALHLFGTGPLDGGAELNARIAMKVKNTISLPIDFEGTADDIEITIKYTERDSSWADDEYSYYEMTGYLQSLRKLLTDSGVLAADSLLIPGEEEVEDNLVKNQLVDECLIRVENLKARIEILQADFKGFFENEISIEDAPEHTFTDVQINALRELLLRASVFGVPGTIPDKLFDIGNDTGMQLLAAADGASKAIAGRLKQSEKDMLVAVDNARSNDVRISSIQEISKKLLGKAFVLLPHFNLRNGTELNEQLALDKTKGLLRAAPAMEMENWSQSLSHVRERMAGLDTVQMWAENFDRIFPEKAPVQFPFALDGSGQSVDHWLGIEFPVGYQPTEDKLSIVIMNSTEITKDLGASKAGLLVDEWVEIIPNLDETTGITFNYDQPDAKPPNNLLLAVTPHETGQWNWDDLVFTLEDTLKMAKNRAVEPEHLEDTVFGQVLPGIMTEIVPPQLLSEGGDDSGDAQENPLGLQVVTDFGVVNSTYDESEE